MILLFIRQPAGVIYQNGEVLDIGNELNHGVRLVYIKEKRKATKCYRKTGK